MMFIISKNRNAEHPVSAVSQGKGHRTYHHLADHRLAERPDSDGIERAHQRTPWHDDALLPVARLCWQAPRPAEKRVEVH